MTPAQVTPDSGHFLSWVRKAGTFGALAVEEVTLPSLEQTLGGQAQRWGRGRPCTDGAGLPGLEVGMAFWFAMGG